MVFLYLADGFEEIEAISVVDVLRRAKVSVVTVSIMKDLTVTGSHDIPVVADALFEDVSYGNCEMLILPGGGPGTQRLLGHSGLKDVLLDFAASGRTVAAICAAPMVLARHGLLEGRQATIYDGMDGELADGKAVYRNEAVVRDGNIVTSKGPGTATQFALKLAELLAGQGTADEVKAAMLC